MLIVSYLVCVLVLAYAFLGAPSGYEDEHGYHEGDKEEADG